MESLTESLFVFLLGLAVLVSAVLTGLFRAYAVRTNLLDVPNQRSSHHLPTPRGGGVGVVVTFILASVWLYYGGYIETRTFGGVLCGSLLVALVGFWDDHGNVSRKIRMTFHVLAAGCVAFAMGAPIVKAGPWVLDLSWFSYILFILGIVWLINLYNFMDGIDAIASIEAITVAIPLAVCLYFEGNQGLSYWLLFLASSMLGFLVWNWPPAKIFMGDVGSGFTGFVFGAICLVIAAKDPVVFWAALIMLGVFIVDATLTLIVRILRGEKWYNAHCDHAYQKASRMSGKHLMVSISVGLINLLWLTPLAFLALLYSSFGPLLLAVAYTPLVMLAIRLRAGRPDHMAI